MMSLHIIVVETGGDLWFVGDAFNVSPLNPANINGK